MNFNLGINTTAVFEISLLNSAGPIAVPFSRVIPPVVPPKAISMSLNSLPNLGTIIVRPSLGSAPGQGYCAEWTTVNTSQ